MFKLVLFSCLVYASWGFVAYDCRSPTILGIHSMGDVDTCSQYNIVKKAPLINDLTVVQVPKFYEFQVEILSVEIRRVPYYCSYYRLSSLTMSDLTSIDFTPANLSPNQMVALLSDETVQLPDHTLTATRNSQILIAPNSHTDRNGFCHPYSTHLVALVYKITHQVTNMKVLLDTDGEIAEYVVFDEKVRDDPSKPLGWLSDGSLVAWHKDSIKQCPLEIVHTGQFSIMESPPNKHVVTSADLGVSLVTSGTQVICSLALNRTQDPFLFLLPGHHPSESKLNPLVYFSWSSLILTSVQYSQTKAAGELNDAVSQISRNLCQLETRLKREIVFGARTEPDKLAYRLTGKKGVIVVISGDAIQVLKCQPSEAKLRVEPMCHEDVPISLLAGNQSEFMDPVTHMIKNSSSQIPCHDTANPFFTIRGQWYKLTPHLQAIPEPTPLPTSLHKMAHYNTTTVKGLYPHELRDRAETSWVVADKKQKVINLLLNGIDQSIGYHKGGSGSLSSVIQKEMRNPRLVEWNLVLTFVVSGLIAWNLGLTYKVIMRQSITDDNRLSAQSATVINIPSLASHPEKKLDDML